MSNHNRFQVLAEHEDPGKLHLQVEEAPHQVAQDTRQPTSGEEGWDDDLDISEGEDSGDNDVIEDGKYLQDQGELTLLTCQSPFHLYPRVKSFLAEEEEGARSYGQKSP